MPPAQLSFAIALLRLSFALKHSDPEAGVATALQSVKLFDEQIAAGRKSYLVVSRRARALRRLSEAQLFAGQAQAAWASAAEGVAEQRKVAARDKQDLQEKAVFSLMLVAAGEAADALRDWKSAADLLTEAEQIAGTLYSRSRNDLTLLMPLAAVRQAWGAHWEKVGDPAQARAWFQASKSLWIEFPEQSDFVRREAARVLAP